MCEKAASSKQHVNAERLLSYKESLRLSSCCCGHRLISCFLFQACVYILMIRRRMETSFCVMHNSNSRAGFLWRNQDCNTTLPDCTLSLSVRFGTVFPPTNKHETNRRSFFVLPFLGSRKCRPLKERVQKWATKGKIWVSYTWVCLLHNPWLSANW